MRYADLLMRRAAAASIIGLVLAVAALFRLAAGDGSGGTVLLLVAAFALWLYSRRAGRRAERIYANAYNPKGRF